MYVNHGVILKQARIRYCEKLNIYQSLLCVARTPGMEGSAESVLTLLTSHVDLPGASHHRRNLLRE